MLRMCLCTAPSVMNSRSAMAVLPRPSAISDSTSRSRGLSRSSSLSGREREVLALMAEGLGNAAVAERLFVTEGAVHKHIRSIFAKLDLAPSDRADRRVTAVLRYLEESRRRA